MLTHRGRRKLADFLLLSLVAVSLAGCGGSSSKPYLGGDNANPSPAAGQAIITAVSPAMVSAGGPSLTIAVTGQNLQRSTTVMWNTTPLVTQYVSSTELQAQVPASLIGAPGTVELTPSPEQTFNFGTQLSISGAQLSGNPSFAVSKVALAANDMVWSPAQSRLYLSLSDDDARMADTIVAFDPSNERFGASVQSSGAAGKLAVAADGSYLYAAFNESFSVERYTLPSLQADVNVPLAIGANSQYLASDLAVDPNDAHTLAVARISADVSYSVHGDVVLFRDAAALPATISSGTNFPIAALLWGTAQPTLYGLDNLSDLELFTASASTSGLLLTGTPPLKQVSGRLHFDSATGELYADSGVILDAKSGTQLSQFPINALQSGFRSTPLMVPDGSLGIAYFLGSTIDGPGSSTYVIEAFDLLHQNLLGTATIPNVSGTPYEFVRWGSNGLAFLTTDPMKTGAATGVYVLSGSFVTSPAP